MMKARSAYAASSIRRRSATWTILLGSMCRSRKRASASWMMRARSCGKRGWRVNLTLCCRCSPSIASSELGWKPDPCRNGFMALTYRATVDVPARFRKSKAVGAVFGLTCAKYQSGEVDRNGRISRCGDEMMRVMLYEEAQSMLRSKKWSWLKAWAMQIARRRGMKKAIVALARRLAVIMHRIWVDGTEFRWTREQATAAAA